MKNINEEIKKIKIVVPSDRNKLVAQALENINNNDEIKTLWEVINTNALERLKMTDHGHVHFQIVANIGMKMTRLLKKSKIPLSVESDFGLSYEHGELIVLLGCLLHDLGMSINRKGHEEFSVIVANRLLRDVLDFLPLVEQTIVISETLHAIISHRSGGKPITVEAGIVRVADALDMSEGRSRFPYEEGFMDIHTLSAQAIDEIKIESGEEKPISIQIIMNNSVGLFQIEELMKEKLEGSGIEKYIAVKAYLGGDQEKNLMKDIAF
ncbi:HD domain-containing protein [candidate division WWE3 bacterium]|jgi:metal-dependent HD superfamily phosphatase/phosphodiesterase|uniref:HD domain-containing protein n=1 Tax=candidate division WWE3 bacterium TaxID=2053526 RepID=A0A3A4ZJS2_UNCKA|nr:MAG: HD domain-containing protein [candidate division WWE3 bacterium]